MPNLWKRHKWLVLRRFSQLTILALFLSGPYLGIWILKGNLASSDFLGLVGLSDPFITLQSFAAGHTVAMAAVYGALIVTASYLLIGGRTFCGWVCPINMVTDSANALRKLLGIKYSLKLSRSLRLGFVPVVLVVSYITGEIAFEAVNPITILHRGLLFGLGSGWLIIVLIFVFDLFAMRDGWCGHLCPVGAFYGLLGKVSLLRLTTKNRADCTKCGDCFHVCPEPQIIAPALYPNTPDDTAVLSSDCINCGRCISICDEDVFKFALLDRKAKP